MAVAPNALGFCFFVCRVKTGMWDVSSGKIELSVKYASHDIILFSHGHPVQTQIYPTKSTNLLGDNQWDIEDLVSSNLCTN